MIRPFTAVCVLLAAGSGLYLYTEKHRTTLLDQQISQIIQHTQQVREHTAMLRAEWALLNQPDRLQSLAGRFLPGLHPMAPAQFVQMASLAQHLPEIAAPVAPPAPAPEMTSVSAPQQAIAPASQRAMTLAPQQVMARSVTHAIPAPDEFAVEPAAEPPAADIVPPRPQRARALPHPVQLASLAAPPRHPAARMQPPSRPPSPVASGPAPARPAVPRGTPAGRMASYDGGAVRNLLGGGLSGAGSYSRPLPIAASWHPLRPVAVLSAAVDGGTAGSHSSLGFSHAALSAPVPVQDGD